MMLTNHFEGSRSINISRCSRPIKTSRFQLKRLRKREPAAYQTAARKRCLRYSFINKSKSKKKEIISKWKAGFGENT